MHHDWCPLRPATVSSEASTLSPLEGQPPRQNIYRTQWTVGRFKCISVMITKYRTYSLYSDIPWSFKGLSSPERKCALPISPTAHIRVVSISNSIRTGCSIFRCLLCEWIKNHGPFLATWFLMSGDSTRHPHALTSVSKCRH